MDRLTKVMQCNDGNKLYDFSNEVEKNIKDFSSRLELMFEKLAMYEDLEEHGKLLQLPCNIDDNLYYFDENNPDGNEILKCTVIEFKHNRRGIEYIIGDYFSKTEGITYKIGIKPSEIGVNAFYNEAEAYAKLDLEVTIGQTLYVIPVDGQDIRKAEVVSINPHYYNDAGFKLSEMSSKDYKYYLDVKVRYLDDIHTDLPVTVTFRLKDFKDEVIFTSEEEAKEKLAKLKGEIKELW